MFFAPSIEVVDGSEFVVESRLESSSRGVNEDLVRLVKEEATHRGIEYIEGVHDPAQKPISPSS